MGLENDGEIFAQSSEDNTRERATILARIKIQSVVWRIKLKMFWYMKNK